MTPRARRIVGLTLQVLVVVAALLMPNRASAQSRADSLDIVTAAVDKFTQRGGTYFVGAEEELLLAALELHPNVRVTRLGSRTAVFCGEGLSDNLVRPNELVGSTLSAGIWPGLPAAPGQPAPFDPLTNDRVAYVGVSTSCLSAGGGGGPRVTLPDGRVAERVDLVLVYEARKAEEGWVLREEPAVLFIT